jgi:hypothetical protein
MARLQERGDVGQPARLLERLRDRDSARRRDDRVGVARGVTRVDVALLEHGREDLAQLAHEAQGIAALLDRRARFGMGEDLARVTAVERAVLHAVRFDELAVAGRDAERDVVAGRLQRACQRDVGLHVAARADGQDQEAHPPPHRPLPDAG